MLPQYAWVGVGRDDGNKKGEYSPIFYLKDALIPLKQSTLWLSETPHEPSVGWDAALPRIITFAHFKMIQNDQTFWHFNTHYDHQGHQAREESSKLILKILKDSVGPKEAVLLTGDFNSLPTDASIEILIRVLEDPSNRTGLDGPTGTFNQFRQDVQNNQRIDYILTKNVKPNTYIHHTKRRKNERWLSDHLPVILEFNLQYEAD